MPQKSTIRVKSFVTFVMVCGFAVIAYAVTQFKAQSAAHFLGVLCAAALASRLTVKIPRLTASLSLDVPFVILTAVQMGFSAAVLVAGVSTFIQCLKPSLDKSGAVKLLFNVAALSVAAAAAASSAEFFVMAGLKYAVAGAALLAVNSVLVALVVSLDGHGSAAKIWAQLITWSFPAYVLGAGLASMMVASQPMMGWYVPILTVPVMVLVFQSYRKYCGTGAPVLSQGTESMQHEHAAEEVTA